MSQATERKREKKALECAKKRINVICRTPFDYASGKCVESLFHSWCRSLSHPIHGTKLANEKKGEIRQNDALPRIAARYIRNWDYYTNIDMEWTTRNNSIQTFSIHTFSRWWFGCHIERVTLSLSLALSLGYKCAISNLIHTIIHLGDENENSPAIFAVFVNRLETRAIFWTGKRVYHAENSLLRSINLDILLPTTRRIRFQPKWRHMPFFSSQYQKDSEIR